MRILICINHPAHVHYFRNLIKIMESDGHEFRVMNRDSDVINKLLDFYGIDHITGKKRRKRKGVIASFLGLSKAVLACLKVSRTFNPDLYLGFASAPCAITSWICRKPSVLLDDTEFNKMNHMVYMPFCSTVLTPFYFQKHLDEGKKQLYFNAFIEQLFLHSKYYKPSCEALNELGLKRGEYVLIRLSSFDAHHDVMAHPLSESFKKHLITTIAARFKVVLSLEKDTSDPFYQPYIVRFSPEKMHDVEANAKFLVTEGITMASEAYILGVPYLLINPLKCGYIDYQIAQTPDLYHYSINEKSIMEIVEHFMSLPAIASCHKESLERQTINPTAFLVWFVENYPESKKLMQENPQYQNRFQ